MSTKTSSRKSIKGKSLPAKQPASHRELDSTSDDDYAGLDQISDSDEEEPDVEMAEEQAIIDDFDGNDSALQPYSTDGTAADEDNDNDSDAWVGFNSDDENLTPIKDSPLMADFLSGGSPTPTPEDIHNGGGDRHVHFDISDSDEDDDLDANKDFPDLFLDQESINPAFRQMIENDADDDARSDGSHWEFSDEDLDNVGVGVATVEDESSDTSDGDDGGASGYETDEGETTEEDLPPAARFLQAKTVLNRQPADQTPIDSSDSEEDIPVIRRKPMRRPRPTGPKLGTWLADTSKPFVILDSTGKKAWVYRAKMNRRHSSNAALSSPANGGLGTPLHSNAHGGHGYSQEQMSPMLSNSANLMISAMYNELADYMDPSSGGTAGPPEAFYPFPAELAELSPLGFSPSAGAAMAAANGGQVVVQDEPWSSSMDEDDVDDEDKWNIADLIDFGDHSSAGEGDGDASDDEDGTTIGRRTREGSLSNSQPASPSNLNLSGASPSSTPVRPSTARSEDQVHPLLEHFDRGFPLVSAFRRHQDHHKLLLQGIPARSLQFRGGGNYLEAPIRGIKAGRIREAGEVVAPGRRRRGQNAMKRKASAETTNNTEAPVNGNGHSRKRSRSINA